MSDRPAGRLIPGPRVTGFPRSSNGASSLHLQWLLDLDSAVVIDSIAVTLEVIDAPVVDRLYFWAMQVDFADERGRRAGGAHLGLQWHPEHPGSTAVNWGGYDAKGGVLHGSESALRSALGNPHTRDLPWTAATPYRLTIGRAPQEDQPGGSQRLGAVTAWRGTVTNEITGRATVVRDLYPAGDRIVGATMWSEVFARCDDPSAAVRWSQAEAITTGGTVLRPKGFGVNYQSAPDGGCANSDSSPDSGFDPSATSEHPADVDGGLALVQRTSVARRTAQGTVIRNL